MASGDFFIDINDFTPGLQVLEDATNAPGGSAQIMQNMVITDRGGIAPRPGTLLIGTYNSDSNPVVGFYNYVKSGVATEILVKSYNGRLEYFHPDLQDWYLIKAGYTLGAEFGFREHLINTEFEDYLYFCNAKEPYSRWSGSYTQLNGAYVSGVTLTVDSTLKTTTYELGTQTGATHTATTLSDTSKTWATDQWKGFYILITSGAQSGRIGLISGNTATVLTFATVGADPGAGCTYQIRMPKFAASGTLVVGTNGTNVAYSAIPSSTTFTITDPSVGFADNSPVTVLPTEYPAAPRGNRLENHHTRMIVGGVQSGMSRDAAGVLQGSQSTASIYVSKIKNATDFSFAAPRVAGEGDIITAPYGGGNITDVINFEDSFAIFKRAYIELDKYATDNTADVPSSTPLKSGFGSVSRVVKGRDDVYFTTVDNQITSLSRVQFKDTIPQSTNIGILIKRLLDTFDFSNIHGDEYGQRLFFTCKQRSQDSANNQIIVYNRLTKSFEGIWLLNAYGFTKTSNKFYYAESTGPNVWEMFTGLNDVRGTNIFGITASWRSNWIHLVPQKSRFRSRPSQFQIQSINGLAYEGYIKDGTTIRFSLYTDFSENSDLFFTFGNIPSDQGFISGSDIGVFLADNPLGLEPIGTLTTPNPNGERHFKFIVYFPDIYCNHLALGVDSSGTNQSYEISRIGISTAEEQLQASDNIKNI